MCAEVGADASDMLNDYYSCPSRTCHRINFKICQCWLGHTLWARRNVPSELGHSRSPNRLPSFVKFDFRSPLTSNENGFQHSIESEAMYQRACSDNSAHYSCTVC
jgi:hypothetical protein